MNKHLCILLFFLTILVVSCTFSENVKQHLDERTEDATKQLIDDAVKARNDFNTSFYLTLRTTSDTMQLKKFDGLRNSLIKTSDFIETILIDLSKLDNNDPNNVKLVKNMFNQGLGDTLFNYMNLTYKFVIDIAADIDTKKSIEAKANETLCNLNKGEFIDTFFEQSTPGMATWILLGMKADFFHQGEVSIRTQFKNQR